MSSKKQQPPLARHRLPIHFIRTKDRFQLDCYYFLMCSHQKIRMLREKVLMDNGSPTVNVAQCGTVIASGYGKEPTQAIRDMLEEKYGYKLH